MSSKVEYAIDVTCTNPFLPVHSLRPPISRRQAVCEAFCRRTHDYHHTEVNTVVVRQSHLPDKHSVADTPTVR